MAIIAIATLALLLDGRGLLLDVAVLMVLLASAALRVLLALLKLPCAVMGMCRHGMGPDRP